LHVPKNVLTVSLVTSTCKVFVPCRHHRAGGITSRPMGNVVLKAGRLIKRSTVQKETRTGWLGHAEKARAARLNHLRWSW